MPKIFISYRQKDTMAVAGRILDRLKLHFGQENVFMDVDGLPIGEDFRKYLTDAVGGCDIFLALIGEQWLTISHNGQRRLDDVGDFVRIEVETALQRGIPLIPILIGAAAMPRAEQLPASLANLCFRHAAQLDPGRRFDNDIGEVIRGLENWVRKLVPGPHQPEAQVRVSQPPPASPKVQAEAVQLFDPGEFEAEERHQQEVQREKQRQEQAARVKAAEDGLGKLVLRCLERTQGKPDKQANDAIAGYCREHSLDAARARALIAEARSDWSRPKPGKVWTNSLGMKFAWIPPGTFLMGSPNEEKERQASEIPHKVTLSKGFYMGVHAVTQEQWQAVMGNNPSHFKNEKSLPVEQVSWEDCQEFIKKLRGKDNKAYRLPTEAEWEYSCRAGTTTPFYFGQTISPDQANYDGNHTYGNGKKGVYRQKTTTVGSFPANAWGLFDTHGNVWEWCQDWLGDYPQNDVVDPQGPNTGQYRVLRGGSWINGPGNCRSANRSGFEPGLRGHFIGCRLCFCLD